MSTQNNVHLFNFLIGDKVALKKRPAVVGTVVSLYSEYIPEVDWNGHRYTHSQADLTLIERPTK